MKKKPSKTLVAQNAAYKKLARIFETAKEHSNTVDRAIAHSLKKWRAIAARDKKLLPQDGAHIEGPDDLNGNWQIDLDMTSDSCALCLYSQEKAGDDLYESKLCPFCPLYLVRGNVSCDKRRRGEVVSPWQAATQDGDYKPMIGWLEVAERMRKLNAIEIDEDTQA